MPERKSEQARFIVDDLKFAHFTVTDVAGRRFYFQQKTSRGAFGEAGFGEGARLAWLDEWELLIDEAGGFRVRAASKEMEVDLKLAPAKPAAIHGTDGISRKAAGEGHASHYYSLTRLETTGMVRVDGKEFATTGSSWFDHEWATNQLAKEQVGWDWLSAHLDDGTELMLYRMRLADGTMDPTSSGTFVEKDGATRHLARDDFKMIPGRSWKSEKSGATYPIGWEVEVGDLKLLVQPMLENQELALLPLAYWEGAVEVSGTRGGRPIKGRGYLELTGYAGPLRELQR